MASDSPKKVIAVKYLPVRPPIGWTIVAWLVLDRFGNNPTAWGIVGTLLVILWIAAIIAIFTQDMVHPKDV